MEPIEPTSCELEPLESDKRLDSNDTLFSEEMYNQDLATVSEWVEKAGGDPAKAFARVLIVNNGLSALRIIQGITSLSNLISQGKDPTLIQAVAIASDADWVGDCQEDAQQRPNYLKEPDIIIARIPGLRPKNTYQNQDEIIALARKYRCDAIAVGWGHLAENVAFASRVENEGLVFVGPHAEAMSLMGDKIMSKLIMDEAEVPMLPWNGSNISLSDLRADVEAQVAAREDREGPLSNTDKYGMLFDLAYERVGVDSIEAAQSVVDNIQLPVVIKATAGGGGRGIRFITIEKDLESGLQAAISEASAAFGNDTVFIEKAADPGSRHVEVQILADTSGTVIALGERECSIQRHNQKLIEESGDDIPISDETRKVLRKAAVAAARAANYVNAGTVEFLVDKDGNPYFMEMNTRLQVEHIATEAVYPGLDLVTEQLKIAMGIPLRKELIALSRSFTTGKHSISVRITAENPNAGFSSQTGTLESLDIPNLGPNTPRAYFSFSQGGTVHSFADSQIGHVVVSAPSRESARQYMVAFLNKLRIKGILTNLQFSSAIMQDEEYIDGKGIHVNWLKQRLDDARSKDGATLGGSNEDPQLGLAAVAILDYLFQKAESKDKFYANLISSRSIGPKLVSNTGFTRVKYGKHHYTIIVREISDELYELVMDNDQVLVRFWERLGPSRFMMEYDGIVYQVFRTDETSITHIEVGGHTITFERDLDPDVFRAPLAGIIASINISAGDTVGTEDTLFTMEAMKMISSLDSPRDATISEVFVEAGSIVEAGTPLLKFTDIEDHEASDGPVTSGAVDEEEEPRLHFRHNETYLDSKLLRKWRGDGESNITIHDDDLRTVINNIMRGFGYSNNFLDLLTEELKDMKGRLSDEQWILLVHETVDAFYKDEQYFKGTVSLGDGLSIAEKKIGAEDIDKYELARSHANLHSKKKVLLTLFEPISSMEFESIVSDLKLLTELGYSEKYRDISARAEELIHLIHPLHEARIDLPKVMENIVAAHESGDLTIQNEMMKNILTATESMISQLIKYIVTGSGYARKIAGKLIIMRAYRRHKDLSCEYEHLPGGKRIYVWRLDDAETNMNRMGLVSLVESGESIHQSLERMYERLQGVWKDHPDRTNHTGDVLELLIQWPSDIKSSDELSQHLGEIVNKVLAKENLRRVTFVVQTPHDRMPGFFTFRRDEEDSSTYSEDTLCRNLHPSLAYMLDLKQLEPLKSNIVKLPSADPLVHIYHHRIPNPRGSELPDIENRIFVRTVIRNSKITMGSEGPSFPGAEKAFSSSLQHLRVSYSATGARSHNNQIYMGFAKPIKISFDEYQKFVKRMNRHMSEYADVDLTRTEIRGRVYSWQATGKSIDMLVAVDNPTGLLPEMKGYVIDTNGSKKSRMLLPYNEFLKQNQKTGYKPSEDSWIPFSELIKPMTALDKKRVIRRQKGKAYVYDRLSLLRNELESIWSTSGKSMPDEILTAQELIADPEGIINSIDRPAGENSLSIVAWRVSIKSPEAMSGREFIVVSGDMTVKGGSVSIEEDILFSEAAGIARDEGIPFVYFAEGSGARIGLSTIVTKHLSYDDKDDVFHVDDKTFTLLKPLIIGHQDPGDNSRYIVTSILGGVPGINIAENNEYLYVSDPIHDRFKNKLTTHPVTVKVGSKETKRWVIDSIDKQYPLINYENLSGSAMMARACSLTYHSVPTMAVVTDTCTGIIAYNVRLLKRIIQTQNSEIILTGYRALNSLYGGDDVYSSNRELGGPHIMGPNGVSHHIVDDESQACRNVLSWLSGVPVQRGYPSPTISRSDPVERDISETLLGPEGLIKSPGPEAERPVPYDSMELVRTLFDESSTEEAMEQWGGTVHVGRATLGGYPVGFITVNTRTVEKEVPADPSIEGSAPVTINQFGQVWYPDSAYKTSQWIQFMKYERRPLIIMPNWRGFAGGKIDLYEEIVKFGAMIVDELVHFDLPVILYIPPYAELRGGAWVVVDPQINPEQIVLLADEHATGSILEPSGMEAVPLIQRQISRDMIQRDPILSKLYRNRTKYATQMDRIKKIDQQIEEREAEIWPEYLRKWTKIFRLHNTAERMGALGIASEVVPTSKAREAIFRNLMNGLEKLVNK